jgi:hypothetical protein
MVNLTLEKPVTDISTKGFEVKRTWLLIFCLDAVSASAQIAVKTARWETIGGGRWCDAQPRMAQACDGKTYCQVRVDPSSLCGGDPFPGHLKTLAIAYSCYGQPQGVLAFSDGKQAVLLCRSNGNNTHPKTQGK